MGTICRCNERCRGEFEADVGKTIRQVQPPCGRRLVPISNDGIPVRGPTKMVLRRSHKRNQTKQDRHRTQKQRMECTERRHSTNSPEISGAVDDADVHKSTRPLQPGGSNLVFRMQSLSVGRNVKFDECVTVYKLDDWPADVYREARRGLWMQYAVDRSRFERRVREIEVQIGHIFSDDHRKKIVCRLYQ
jgi:hypothetical protein